MKKILCVSLLFYFGIAFSQFNNNDNTFRENEEVKVASDEDDGPPGNPPGVPINDYLPILILTAVGMMVIMTTKKQYKKH